MALELASLVVAAIGVAVALIWFVTIAYLYPAKSDLYFASRSLDASFVRANLAATATSLAGAVFFFLNSTPAFGWIILLVPLFNVAGVLLFLKLVNQEPPDPQVTGSIFRFLLHKTKDPVIAKHANYVVILAFVTVFVTEIVIGSQIFSYFFAQDQVFQAAFRLVGMFCLSTIVLWYIWKGGFAAVSQTDKWQFALVAVGIALVLAFLLSHYSEAGGHAQGFFDVFRVPKFERAFQVTFFINLVFINLFMPSSQNSTWQRYSAAESQEKAVSGFVGAIWKNILPLWYAVIALSALLSLLGSREMSFVGLFDLLRESGGFSALIVFPLVFVGLVAALLSTADSILVALMLAIHDGRAKEIDQVGTEVDRDVAREKSIEIDRREALYAGAVVVMIAWTIGLLFLLSQDFNRTVTQLLFAGYGVPCLLFPIVAAGWSRHVRISKPGRVIFALWGGVVLLLVGSIYGMVTGDFRATHLGPIAGIGLVAAVVRSSRSEAEIQGNGNERE